MNIENKDIGRLIYNEGKKVYELYSHEDKLILSITEPILQQLVDLYLDVSTSINEKEELRMRAIERIAKLRRLSFDIDSDDPKNEFETVPAYLRRNIELEHTPAEIYYGGQGYSEKITKRLDLPEDYSEPVFIFLPAKEISIMEAEKLTNACGDFMEALDYELEVENEPIMGSFIQKLWFKVKKGTKVTRDEVAQDFVKGKKALELKYIELPTAEQTEKLANSAAKIVELLDGQDEGIVRLGALIVLKKQVDGKPKIIIQQLNFDLISVLDRSPQLLQNLQTAYELLTGDVKGSKHFDETERERLSI